MGGRGRGSRGRDLWGFPAAGLAAAGLIAATPGSPLGPERWPLKGPFGAFTWLACFLSIGLGVTLLLVAIGLGFRRGRGAVLGRTVPAALAFGLLALAAYAAAARADRIARNPAVALAVALAVLAALRVVTSRFTPPRGGGVDG